MEQVYQRYLDQGFVILGIASSGLFGNETEQTLTVFKEQTAVSFPIVWDLDRGYGAFNWPPSASSSPFPRQALLDADGVVVYLAADYNFTALDLAIQEALP